jgi:hypothetical protein
VAVLLPPVAAAVAVPSPPSASGNNTSRSYPSIGLTSASPPAASKSSSGRIMLTARGFGFQTSATGSVSHCCSAVAVASSRALPSCGSAWSAEDMAPPAPRDCRWSRSSGPPVARRQKGIFLTSLIKLCRPVLLISASPIPGARSICWNTADCGGAG